MTSFIKFLLTLFTILFICTFGEEIYAKPSELIDQNISLSEESQSDGLLEIYAPYTERREGFVNELRWMSQSLRALRLRLNPSLPLRSRELAQKLQRAQLGLLNAQTLEVALDLNKVLRRSGVKDSVTYPQLLNTLGSALFTLDLKGLGISWFESALKVGRGLSSLYERLFIQYLERLKGDVPLSKIKAHWQTYIRLCKKSKRPPSAVATYVYGKSIYFTKNYPLAKEVMSSISKDSPYALRAQYFLGIIALRTQSIKDAQQIFVRLDQEIKSRLVRRQPKKRALGEDSDQRDQSDQREAFISKNQVGFWGPPGQVINRIGALTISTLSPNKERERALEDVITSNTSNRQKIKLSPELQALLMKDVHQHSEGDVLQQSLQTTLNHSKSMSKSSQNITPSPEDLNMFAHIKAAFDLTLARLAILSGELDEAWIRYRNVPLGTIYGGEAQLEAAYVLRLRRDYLQCARLLDQILSFQSNDLSTFQLKLWQAEMLVKAGKLELGQLIYKQLKVMITKELRAVETSQDSDLLFPPEVLAWVQPQDARKARYFGRTIWQQETSLRQSQLLWNTLYQVQKSKKYPIIKEGDRLTLELINKLKRLKKRLIRVEPQWAKWDQNQSMRGEGQQEKDQRSFPISNEAIRRGISTLEQRVAYVQRELKRINTLYDQKLSKWISAEYSTLVNIDKKIKEQKKQLKKLSDQLKRYALKHLNTYKAQIILGPINVAFWLKEKASEELMVLRDLRLSELNPINHISIQNQSTHHSSAILDELVPYVESLLSPNRQEGSAQDLLTPSSTTPLSPAPLSPAPLSPTPPTTSNTAPEDAVLIEDLSEEDELR